MKVSLVESFVDRHKGDIETMKLVLECSDIPKTEYVKGNPLYIFSDDSYIMFNSLDENIYSIDSGGGFKVTQKHK